MNERVAAHVAVRGGVRKLARADPVDHYQKYSPDSQSTNEKCEQWARHLLYAAPRPAGRSELAAGRRDWLGVRHFVAQHRQGEYAYVTRAVGGMRQTIWAFIQELNRSLAGDHETE